MRIGDKLIGPCGGTVIIAAITKNGRYRIENLNGKHVGTWKNLSGYKPLDIPAMTAYIPIVTD